MISFSPFITIFSKLFSVCHSVGSHRILLSLYLYFGFPLLPFPGTIPWRQNLVNFALDSLMCYNDEYIISNGKAYNYKREDICTLMHGLEYGLRFFFLSGNIHTFVRESVANNARFCCYIAIGIRVCLLTLRLLMQPETDHRKLSINQLCHSCPKAKRK